MPILHAPGMSLHGTTKAIYQLSAVSGAAILPENVPDGVKSNVKELGDQKGMMAHGSFCRHGCSSVGIHCTNQKLRSQPCSRFDRAWEGEHAAVRPTEQQRCGFSMQDFCHGSLILGPWCLFGRHACAGRWLLSLSAHARLALLF